MCQAWILSACLFNLYAEYIIRNAELDESHAGIKIGRRHNNNLKYADDASLMAESEEELKSVLIRVKEESAKAGLKLNIQNTKIMTSVPLFIHAQSLQSCPTPCDHMYCSMPGFSVYGDSPGKNTGVGCHACLQEIFLTWGSNQHLLYLLCLLHWQAGTLPLVLHGKSYHFMANRRGKSRKSDILFSWASKSSWMVTAAMKLKETCSLAGKL